MVSSLVEKSKEKGVVVVWMVQKRRRESIILRLGQRHLDFVFIFRLWLWALGSDIRGQGSLCLSDAKQRAHLQCRDELASRRLMTQPTH
ncbi:hypothetical protein L6164_028265 [Bauhinia variegata]|uniref:Uncharacterized protein n=1 Tax=Bauhinia variegata TaxID=167791 RepID=A0ACB9LX59_BAUVA|nr:hypothetical protein L6164_028265 [Bauhinia variegata]